MHRKVSLQALIVWGGLLLVLLLGQLLLFSGSLSAQTYPNRVFKVNLSDQFQGRYGLVYESKIRGRNYMHAHKGFYRREVVVSGLNPRKAGPTIFERLHKFILSDYQKYLIVYGGYERINLPNEQLMMQGPFVEGSVRRYFRHKGPEGCFLQLGLGYTSLFARNYDESFREKGPVDVIHVPKVQLTTGWQFLLGYKNHWAIDLYAGGGWRYPITSRETNDPALGPLPQLHIVWGASFGFAFRRQTRYF